MEMFKEEVEIVEEEENEPPKVFLPDPSSHAKDVSLRGGGGDEGRKTEGAISSTLGAMVPLVRMLDLLLEAPPERSSKKLKDAIRLLKKDVEEISCYLDELSEVEDPPPMAMCWMNEARDLSYDMADFIHNSYERPEDPSTAAKTIRAVRKLTSHGNTPKRLLRFISEFRMYIKEAIQRREAYGLSDSGPCSVSTLRRRYVSVGPMLPMPYEKTADIVLDGRMNEFMTSLAKDGDQQLKVVSVFGSACLGKTTFARVLYSNFGKQYNCRAFIRVPRKPDMKRIFGYMLSQLQGQNPPIDCKETDLIDNIKNYLQDKRYLIIIDDVWTVSLWNILNHAFPKGKHGSKIITTTQIEDVALRCCRYQTGHVFEMKPLDENHSRKLFFNRLFGSESQCPQQWQEMLNDIVEICGGLPLATISIASLLASQPVITEDLLEHIYQSLSSCFLANSTSERVRQVLNLSFNNLPYHLKTCLLYLSMYPEGSTFYKDDLVKQWMAEVLINTTEGQDKKEVATSYLDELIGRRFIQPICINYNNEVVSCVVHDVVHDLIAHKSAEENFIVAIDYSQMNVALFRKVRRLSLLFGDARYAKTPANIRKPQVRSLTFFGLLECVPCITEFKLLCVLNLQLYDHGGDDESLDLACISELFQLRYLKIVSDVCIKLPKHGLQCLETLEMTDARVAMVRGVPCVPYIHLPRLSHLSISDETNLVKWIDSLVSDGKLKYLQDLHITAPSTSASYDVELSMVTLASIISSGQQKLNTIVVRAGSSVKNVVVCGNGEPYIWNDVLLPSLLQRFEVMTQYRSMFAQIPPSVKKHGTLCILMIEVRDLKNSCVDILRGLPALTALSLYVYTAPCQRIIFDKAGFSVLKYFKFRFRSGIAWLKFKAGAMPNLWKLKLVFDAIPQMDQNLVLLSNRPPLEHHKHDTAVISIEHMPGLKEISVKFGGAAADVEYALKAGITNHRSNPKINEQPVDYNLSELKQQRDEIQVDEQDEYDQKQPDEYYKQHEFVEEEQDEYDKQQPKDCLDEEPDHDLDEEPDEYRKEQTNENLGEKPGEYYKTLERSANTSILSPPENHVGVPLQVFETAGFLDYLVRSCAEKLQDISTEEVILVLGVKEDLRVLQRRMTQIQCFLHDAEQRRTEETAVNNWLGELREAMYYADDIIDLARSEGSKLLTDHPSSSTRCGGISFFTCIPTVQKRHKIGVQIRDVNAKIEKISMLAQRYLMFQNMQPKVEVPTVKHTRTTHLVEPNLVGKETLRASKRLVELVLAHKENMVYKVGIVGTGGIGKTALAQSIYSDQKLEGAFSKKAWICVSQKYSEVALLKEVLRNFGVHHEQDETIAELSCKLAAAVADKTFFLVLDDVWEPNVWTNLLRFPLHTAATVVILVTTRHDAVAHAIGVEDVHRVDLMSADVGWELLWKSMNLNEEKDVGNLRNMGLDIVSNKCYGLPLAIKVTASILATKERTENEWRKFMDRSAWSVGNLPTELRGAMYLSYDDLPIRLKLCFLYCALYPEDVIMYRNDLVFEWVAEGFIEHQLGQLLEDTAEEYYYELIQRNLLQPVSHSADHWTCKMHNLLRQLACYISREECFVGDPEYLRDINISKLRRFTAVTKKDIAVLPSMDKREFKLRTFRTDQKPWIVEEQFFKRFPSIRVLSLTDSLVKSIPDYVRNLIHLRLLNLDGTDISNLPESIGSLINLQMLNLSRCKALHSLPLAITRLSNLRRLGLKNTPINQVPNGIGRLEFLNDLDGFPIGGGGHNGKTQDGWKLEELEHLSQLRQLHMVKLERSTPYSTNSLLTDKKHLKVLNLFCTPTDGSYSEEAISNIEKVLEQLIPPHNLEYLDIIGFFGRRFPTWLGTTNLFSVKYLILGNCSSCLHLPSIGQLPNLKHLKIFQATSVTKIGLEFVGRKGANPRSRDVAVAFPKLETLIFWNMPNLEEWSFVEEVDATSTPSMKGEEDISAEIQRVEIPSPGLQLLPRLMDLVLLDCPKLKALPRQLGQEATSLKSLLIQRASCLKVVEDLPFLSKIGLMGCEGLERVSNLPQVQDLVIQGCPNLRRVEGLGCLHKLFLSEDMREISSLWLPGVQMQCKQHGEELSLMYYRSIPSSDVI